MSIPMTANMQTLRSSLNYNFGDLVQEPENTHSFVLLEAITQLVEAMDYSRDMTAHYWSMLDGIKDFERVELEELFARREAIYQAHAGGLIEDWLYSSLVGRNEDNYEIGHQYITSITKPHIERKAQLQTRCEQAAQYYGRTLKWVADAKGLPQLDAFDMLNIEQLESLCDKAHAELQPLINERARDYWAAIDERTWFNKWFTTKQTSLNGQPRPIA